MEINLKKNLPSSSVSGSGPPTGGTYKKKIQRKTVC